MHCSARHGPCGRSNSHLRSLSKCTNMPSFSKPAIYPWKLHKRGSKSIKITTQEVTGFRNLGNWDHAFSSPPETDFIQRIWLSMCWWYCARERERERERWLSYPAGHLTARNNCKLVTLHSSFPLSRLMQTFIREVAGWKLCWDSGNPDRFSADFLDSCRRMPKQWFG